MLCLRASQIWSHLICGRRLQMLWTDIYFNRVCAKVYEIIVFKVYLEIEQWRLGKANLLGMTACGSDLKKTNVLFVGDNINVNHNIGTRNQLEPPWTSDLSAFWNERFLLFIRNLAASIVENVSTQTEETLLCKTYTRRSELFRTNHFWRVDKVSDEIK